jgi:tRNA(Ile)-lysidine synthase
VLVKTMPVLLDVDKQFDPGQTVQVGEESLDTSIITGGRPKFDSSRTAEYVDADAIQGRLTIRSWREGDRFHPLGMKGQKKVSEFLIDNKVPLDLKRRILVVADEKKIVWVCGMRIDDRVRVTKKTKRYLKLELNQA